MATNNSFMNETFGRPRSFQPVAVQDRLPWQPRRTDGRVQVVLCHPLLADEFVEACHAAAKASAWIPQRIDSYVPRPIRNYFKNDTAPKGWQLGDKGTSNHSWATAFDFFSTPADVYPPGGVWTPDDPVPAAFAAEFEKRGWTWGGKWKRQDDPHHEFSKTPPTVINGRLLDYDYTDWLTDMLKQGDTGLAVLDLQLGLIMLKLDGELSGVFGPKTTGLVREVQAIGKATVDGIVGPQTERVIAFLWARAFADEAEAITLAYNRLLGRDPKEHDIRIWTEQVKLERLNVAELARRIFNSPEAVQRRHGGTLSETAPKAPAPAPAPKPAPAPAPPPPPPAPEPAPDPMADLRQELLAISIALQNVAKKI